MTTVTINKKKYVAFDVFKTKKEAFDRKNTISNNSKIFKTDDNKYALFLYSIDVSNKF